MTNNDAVKIEKYLLDREKPKFKLSEMIMEAVYKQIPKEPIGIDWLYCPNCRNSLDVLNFKKYCDECGQALNWGDVE